jgi:hypothetical protein
MENGNQIKAWGAHGGGALSVRYSQDGRLVSCGRDQVAKVWDQNGAQKIAFEAFPDLALKVAFTHDAGRVIGGDWSGLIRAWSTADGKRAGELTSNPPTVADRLAVLAKDLSARQAEHDKLAAAAAAAQAAAQKSAAEAAAAKARLDQSTTELAQARAQADRLKAVMESVKAVKK